MLSFGLAFFLPVYTDELVFKIQQARLHYDQFRLIGIPQPSCGSYAYAVPWLLLPFRLFDSLIYEHVAGPLPIRVIGLGVALVWLALAWYLLRRVAAGCIGSSRIAVGLVAMTTLGVMPFLLVINRPEQILLLAVTGFLLPLLCEAPAKPPSLPSSIMRGVLAVIVAGYMVSVHARAMFLVPLALVFIVRVVGRPVVALACGGALVALTVSSYADFGVRVACPNDPVIMHDRLFLQNLGSAVASGRTLEYLEEFLRKVDEPSTWLLTQFLPRRGYVSDIFPPFSEAVVGWLAPLIGIYFLTLVGLGALAFLFALWKRWHEPGVRLALVGLGSVWAFYGVSVVVQLEKNTYVAELMMPLMSLVSAGSIWVAWPAVARALGELRLQRAAQVGFVGLLALSVLSQVGFAASYLPDAVGAWTAPGYAPGQRFSVSIFGYPSLRPDILRTAAACGIDPTDRPRHLVVDEVTYYALRRAYQPIMASYLDATTWSSHRPDPTDLLARYRSAGMVVGCQWVPEAVRARAKRDGPFCCVPAF